MDISALSATQYPATDLPDRNQGALALANFDQFLRLFVSQLKFQDPLSPMSGEDFLAQTAQFSTVEQLVSLNGKVAQTTALAALQGWATGAAFIGRSVTAKTVDEEGAEVETTGRVVRVDHDPREGLLLGLDNGIMCPLTDVVSVSET